MNKRQLRSYESYLLEGTRKHIDDITNNGFALPINTTASFYFYLQRNDQHHNAVPCFTCARSAHVLVHESLVKVGSQHVLSKLLALVVLSNKPKEKYSR